MSDKRENRLHVPAGLTEAEEADWWYEHRDEVFKLKGDEWEDLEVVEPTETGRMTRLPYVRLPSSLADAIYDLAMERGTTRGELIRSWLEERLQAERGAPPKKASKLKR